MTAFLAVRKADRVELLTDAVYYDPSGMVRDIGSKVHTPPHMRCAIAGRGDLKVTWVFGQMAGALCRTFDDVVSRFAEMMSEMRDIGGDDPTVHFDEHEIVVAGWSESRDRPELHIGLGPATVQRWAHGFEPDVLYMAPILVAGPFPQGLGDSDPEGFDPIERGVPLFEKARQWTGEVAPGYTAAVGHAVGGFIELTTITREGVSRRVIHRWREDRVGEEIAA